MHLRAVFLAGVLAAASLPAQAADTLADIRQDLSVLYVEMQKLKRELSTTGASSVTLPAGTLDRVNAIESELQRLTAKTEQLEFRIGRITADGTNRVGDLEFRLCELEPGCDIAALGKSTTLGGDAATAVPAVAPKPSGTQVAVGEEADFRAAEQAFAEGDYQSAADKFAAFRDAYPGGPYEPQALLGQGRALEALGDTREAARRYLDVYAGYPDHAAAPEGLWRLGTSLGKLGKAPEACVTLAEVSARYPGTEVAGRAQADMTTLECQ